MKSTGQQQMQLRLPSDQLQKIIDALSDKPAASVCHSTSECIEKVADSSRTRCHHHPSHHSVSRQVLQLR